MSFKFPPPPPPPKASPASDASPNTYSSHRGGHGRGRGNRGRARGTLGRGCGYFGGSARGGHDIRDGTRNAQARGGATGGYQQQNVGRGGSNYRGNSNSSPSRSYQQYTSQLEQMLPYNHTPSSVYGHPTLSSQALSGNEAPQMDQTALAHAMSFMTTPAGTQSMADFVSHMASGKTDSRSSSTPMAQSEYSSQQNSSTSGHKRKWTDRSSQHGSPPRNQSTQNAQQPSKKPPRAKCSTAPAVPSFGFTLPPMPTASTAALHKPNTGPHKQKPKVNLGLGHHEATYESSEEEDVDEEASLAAKYRVEGVVFEHNGESISLQTPAEVAAWIKDRRRHFPTQKRIIEKAEEEAIRRAAELEFLRKIKGQTAVTPAVPSDQSKRRKRREQRPINSQVDNKQLREHGHEAAVEHGLLITAPKPKPVDLGLGYASDTGSDPDDSSVASESSVMSSTSESSDDTDSDSEGADASEDDSDAPPESRATKEPIAPVVVPLRQQTGPQPQPRKVNICASWQRNGKCKYGKHCRYPHPEEEDAKRIGLYERLVEQELKKADQLALDAIKYLGRHGFLG